MNEVSPGQEPFAGCGPPPCAVANDPNDERQRAGETGVVVLSAPLGAGAWDMIRAFIAKTSPDDLRLRFGQPLDFRNDATLKRCFDIDGETGEMLLALDEGGAIAGILHRVRVSPCEAEIALIVRSDCKRQGVGKRLLRAALRRAATQRLPKLRAMILRENIPMLRLARKFGLLPQRAAGLSVEVEFDLAACASLREVLPAHAA